MTIARQQLCEYATVLKVLLGSGPRATVKVLLEAGFSMCPLRGYITRTTGTLTLTFELVSAVQWSELFGE
jgi:hypothetical protein